MEIKKEKKSILKRIGEFFWGETIIVTCDFFGEMVDAVDYYECKKMFKPTKKIVELGLEKVEPEFKEKQIDFFRWLEDNYELIIKSVSPSIEKRIVKRIPNYRIQNFKKEFILEYFYIPKCDDKTFDWNITFYADNELQHWCSLDMVGTKVKQILIDG